MLYKITRDNSIPDESPYGFDHFSYFFKIIIKIKILVMLYI